MSTREIIDRYYELANKGDWSSWTELFAAHLVMDEQLAGHIEGRQTLRDMMAGFPKMYASFQNVPRRVVVDDDKVAVFSHISAQTHDGESIEADVANYFHVVGGEIVYMRNIHDTAPFRPVLARSAAQ